jgi:hypothetical protein
LDLSLGMATEIIDATAEMNIPPATAFRRPNLL